MKKTKPKYEYNADDYSMDSCKYIMLTGELEYHTEYINDLYFPDIVTDDSKPSYDEYIVKWTIDKHTFVVMKWVINLCENDCRLDKYEKGVRTGSMHVCNPNHIIFTLKELGVLNQYKS